MSVPYGRDYPDPFCSRCHGVVDHDPADGGCRCPRSVPKPAETAPHQNERHDGHSKEVHADAPARRLVPVSAASIEPRRLRWLWDKRIVLGGLTLLAGREGLGKSTVGGDIVARVTRGDLDGERHGQPGTVLYITSEDSREYTVVPRLMAAGADLDRVMFVDAHTAAGTPDRVVLPLDLDALGNLIRDRDVVLVVLDAATSVMDGRLDGDRDRQMRQALELVGRIANDTGAAVLGIVHFGKRESSDTGKLILGSIAWSQVARSVLAVARDDESGELVISATKANLSPGDTPSLSARIVDATVNTAEGATHAGRVVWGAETDRHARDLLGGSDGEDERTERDEAVEWLTGYLADHGGAAAAKDIVKAAKADGIAERTLKRARSRAGVQSQRQGFGQGAVWSWDPSGPHSAHSGRSCQAPRAHGPIGMDGPNGPNDGADAPDDEDSRPPQTRRRSINHDHQEDYS